MSDPRRDISYPHNFSNDMWVLWNLVGSPWPSPDRQVWYKSSNKNGLNTIKPDFAVLFDCKQSGLDWIAEHHTAEQSPLRLGWELTRVPELLKICWPKNAQEMLYSTKKVNRKRELELALRLANEEDDGVWTKHTRYHWSREFNGEQLHYWPTTFKYQFGKTVSVGDVYEFMKENSDATPNT